ncbi:HlyD family type I secretion periplasmic adaptor subunit [Rhodobacter ferrooxidans]|uniref:Membrane fusion protein (MFP) family protein n=1 Tax=Rhodobacter ferrooxidans TaxID=371731 RepID=C8S4F8_9RHOB|nr:HlyD family type I secretion periplasmic adaptor subunit [Rhodobacter sp. SW2]EEW24125.1 type I secretion membrane fusion protein, HlyD family [Rhodobacter sp. SW2]
MTGVPPAAGKPVWSATRPLVVGFLTLAVLFGGFGLWSVSTNIAGAIVTSGQIEVEQNRQVVQHPDGGVVAEIAVAEGDTVQAGDLLLRLDGATIHSELAIVEGQLYEMLARRARLTAERDDAEAPQFPPELTAAATARADVAELMDGQLRLFNARRDSLARQGDQLAERQKQIESQITGITAQNDALTTQLALIRQELADQQQLLDKGLAQSGRVLALQREEARMRGQVGELTASAAQAGQQITETRIQILRLAADRREEASTQLRDIGSQELELVERRRALVERVARLEIRAPVSGIVLGLQVTTPRAVLRPADPVLYLIPQDRPLIIAAQVPTIHIDQVHAGQEVRLMFSAFSARTTPQLNGHVAVVSADALVDPKSQTSYYRAEIVLDPGEQQKLQGLTLLPGMPVEAFIRTDDRTPLAYLLKPFTDYFNRAFRET